MGDSNWLKLVGIVSATFSKWKNAVAESEQAQVDFDSICGAVGPTNTATWTALEKKLQKERGKNIEVMDQFDITDTEGLPFPDVSPYSTHLDSSV